jgi:hypothetical protein
MVTLSLYIGASLAASAAAAWLVVPRVARWWPVAAAAVLITSLAGLPQQMGSVQPSRYMLAGRPDQRAAAWIDGHLPADARLLVNAFMSYSGTVVVSGDAGVWLPLLAHRAVTVPPISYASEAGPSPDYRQRVKALPVAIRDQGLDSEEVQAMLREWGVTHVYVGQQAEQTNGDAPFVFSVSDLLASPRFRLVYHEDRVWVFAYLPTTGAQ